MIRRRIFKKRRNPPRHLEDDLQQSVVKWFRSFHSNCVILAIPNGGKRNQFEAYRLKRAGVLAGVCDLFIPEPRGCYHGLWIEMKAGKGTPTLLQHKFMGDMRSRGYDAAVINDFETFKLVVEDYLKQKGESWIKGS